MNNNKCQLAAWMEGGKVRMSLDLVKELSGEYLGRIQKLESALDKRHNLDDEVPLILALSQAHEKYGDFLNESGLSFLAFKQYIKATSICTSCSDFFWSDSDNGFVLCRPLRGRFLEMFSKVRNMAAEDSSLSFTLSQSGLMNEWLDI